METEYQKVIAANIALHSRMSDDYGACEPHFRPENVAQVESRLRPLFARTNAQKILDLGCGTGFVINIAKKHVAEIHGVDVTQAMMDKVDRSGGAKIELFNHDSGSFPAAAGAYDMVTAYSFLHHLYDVMPTLHTAFRALRPGGVFFADLDPNYYFWEAVNKLDRNGAYDPIVKREVEMVTYKDEDIQKTFGVAKEVFNRAEYGKNIKGGFRAEDLQAALTQAGFKKVAFFHHWFAGQGKLINDDGFTKEERFRHAEVMSDYLQKAMPLSRSLFKYLGFTAEK